MRGPSKWIGVVIAMVAAAAIANTSHAALIYSTSTGTSGDLNPKNTTVQSIFDRNGLVASSTTERTLSSGNEPAIGTLAAEFKLGLPIDRTSFQVDLLGGGLSAGGIFSEETIKAVGIPSSGLLTFNYSNMVNNSSGNIVVLDADGGSLVGNLTDRSAVTTVPLPAGVWLFLCALIGLVGVVRHKRKRTTDEYQSENSSALVT